MSYVFHIEKLRKRSYCDVAKNHSGSGFSSLDLTQVQQHVGMHQIRGQISLLIRNQVSIVLTYEKCSAAQSMTNITVS